MGMSAAHCQGIVRKMSGNFRVSGEWSPCILSKVLAYLCVSCGLAQFYQVAWLQFMCVMQSACLINCCTDLGWRVCRVFRYISYQSRSLCTRQLKSWNLALTITLQRYVMRSNLL